MSDSVRPHRRQPTWLSRPWNSLGKNTGVGCHFLLQCIKVKSESEVARSTPSDPMDCSLPGSSVHGIFQGRVLEWGATVFSNTKACVGLILYDSLAFFACLVSRVTDCLFLHCFSNDILIMKLVKIKSTVSPQAGMFSACY